MFYQSDTVAQSHARKDKFGRHARTCAENRSMTITPRNSSDATAFPDETAPHKVLV